jgi:hypothetical protein
MKQKIQKLYKKYYNETNLIISYFPIWFCSYYFDWDSFGVLISYLIEAFILLAFYLYLRTQAELDNQKQFKTQISYGNVLYGVIPFFIVQFFIIAGTSFSIDEREDFIQVYDIFTAGGIFTIASLTYFYYKSLKQIKSNRDKRMAFYNTFLSRIIVLTATSLVGLIVASAIPDITLFIVLSFTIPVRIVGEFIVTKKFTFK